MPKRKADDSDDEIVVEKDEAKGGKGSKKAKGGDGKEEKKPRGPPKPKVVKLKKFTEVEERVALGASMERNEAIAKFLEGMLAAYKEGAEYYKAAAVKKVVDGVRAHKEAFRVAQEMGVLPGCGEGTQAKVAEFLASFGEPAKGLVAEAAAAQAEAGRDAEFSWLEDSEREVVVELLKKNEVPIAQVMAWRKDIEEKDFK